MWRMEWARDRASVLTKPGETDNRAPRQPIPLKWLPVFLPVDAEFRKGCRCCSWAVRMVGTSRNHRGTWSAPHTAAVVPGTRQNLEGVQSRAGTDPQLATDVEG